jgi:hypothetical protein
MKIQLWSLCTEELAPTFGMKIDRERESERAEKEEARNGEHKTDSTKKKHNTKQTNKSKQRTSHLVPPL